MYRISALLLSAATLSACATSPLSDKTSAAKNPNATTIEVMPPTPVKAPADRAAGEMTDVMGNALMTSGSPVKATAPAAAAQDAAPIQEAAAPDEAAAPKLENLYYVAQTKWEMVSFVEAVNKADLATALEADGAMTIFAPTSDAFAQADSVDVTAENLKGHIVSGKFTAKDLMARAAKGENTLPTVAGTDLTLYVMGETVKVADASGRLYTVVNADNEASNGVLHQINGVFAGK